MRRWILRILVFLLLGAIVNVAVAIVAVGAHALVVSITRQCSFVGPVVSLWYEVWGCWTGLWAFGTNRFPPMIFGRLDEQFYHDGRLLRLIVAISLLSIVASVVRIFLQLFTVERVVRPLYVRDILATPVARRIFLLDMMRLHMLHVWVGVCMTMMVWGLSSGLAQAFPDRAMILYRGDVSVVLWMIALCIPSSLRFPRSYETLSAQCGMRRCAVCNHTIGEANRCPECGAIAAQQVNVLNRHNRSPWITIGKCVLLANPFWLPFVPPVF